MSAETLDDDAPIILPAREFRRLMTAINALESENKSLNALIESYLPKRRENPLLSLARMLAGRLKSRYERAAPHQEAPRH